MKQKFPLIIILILTCSIAFADRSLLIDFHLLKANGNGTDPSQSLEERDPQLLDYKNHDRKNRTEHMPTLIDYANVAGSSFSDEEKKDMKISLAAYNWDIRLNSSASHVENKRYSSCVEWHTKAVSTLNNPLPDGQTAPEGYNILGVRIHFPTESYNNWALIKPPFKIPAYADKITDFQGNLLEISEIETIGDKFENGYGVIKNVGEIKSIEMRIYGCNYKNSIAILLENDLYEIKEYHFGIHLDFDGWRNIKWENPNYLERVQNRDIFIVPLYPRDEPYVKLDGFRVYRPHDQLGGDFITYIRDVYITHDLAVVKRDSDPIQHEEIWRILETKAEIAKSHEVRKLGHKQILRFLEEQKIHQESSNN